MSTINYVYDDANRLSSVDGVPYTYDNNGNLLNDGVNTYTYDSANRLKTFTNATTTVAYSYNGLGDRLQETVNGITTTFTMDLNTGLTQALSDGTNTYIYGVGRIAQVNGNGTEYFLGDALGSVRQLTNQSGEITYSRAYDPYGVVTLTSGSSSTIYGYTAEAYGDSTELLYLRSRFYASGTGRFLTRDTWNGNANMPMSYNKWNYVDSNPINRVDPTGMCWINVSGVNVWIPDGATPCQSGNAGGTQSLPFSGLPSDLLGCETIVTAATPAIPTYDKLDESLLEITRRDKNMKSGSEYYAWYQELWKNKTWWWWTTGHTTFTAWDFLTLILYEELDKVGNPNNTRMYAGFGPYKEAVARVYYQDCKERPGCKPGSTEAMMNWLAGYSESGRNLCCSGIPLLKDNPYESAEELVASIRNPASYGGADWVRGWRPDSPYGMANRYLLNPNALAAIIAKGMVSWRSGNLENGKVDPGEAVIPTGCGSYVLSGDQRMYETLCKRDHGPWPLK